MPALGSALLHELIPTEAIEGLAALGTPDAATAVARAWDHLDESQRTYALRRFTAAGAAEALRAALKKVG